MFWQHFAVLEKRQIVKLSLEKWAERNFDPAPNIQTVRRWAASDRISPPPVKAGKLYYVEENAEYIPATRQNQTRHGGRPRTKERQGWPANLHERREGYYTYRDPRNGKEHILGRIGLAQAIQEAIAANRVLNNEPPLPLYRRIEGGPETMADLLGKMPADGLKPSTLRNYRYIDKKIIERLGCVRCSALSVRDVAEFIEEAKATKALRSAQGLRARLVTVCKKAQALGWMTSNPASLTESVKVRVQRQRLLFTTFQAIRAKAPKVNHWLENAMLLALVSGQDRLTISSWDKASIRGDVAVITRSKTNVQIAIPLALRLDAIDLSLADVLKKCRSTGAFNRHFIHHVRPRSDRPRGSPVSPASISVAFAEARKLAGIKALHGPTFHEIRSLAKRLYDEQGNVDTVALLGHIGESMSDLYANPRGIEPKKVRFTPHQPSLP